MTTPNRAPDGYRRDPLTSSGPRIRADVVDVYIFRASAPDAIEILQLRRSREPLAGTWQPVMGHVEAGETAIDTARREIMEEVGLKTPSPQCLGFWALEQVWPFYIAAIDCIVLSPRFVAQAGPTWEPELNAEHSAARWIRLSTDPEAPGLRALLDRHFMWPGQRHTIVELLREIVAPTSLSRERLSITLSGPE